jgi:hypothetical protein
MRAMVSGCKIKVPNERVMFRVLRWEGIPGVLNSHCLT